MEPDLNTNQEQHPLFPGGEWEGFYTYQSDHNTKHKMEFTLDFCKQVVTGTGSDDVGAFKWKGRYDTKDETCKMTKYYFGEHTVLYEGNADENGIWGTWFISIYGKGGFHIWPKKKDLKNENVEEEVVALSLET